MPTAADVRLVGLTVWLGAVGVCVGEEEGDARLAGGGGGAAGRWRGRAAQQVTGGPRGGAWLAEYRPAPTPALLQNNKPSDLRCSEFGPEAKGSVVPFSYGTCDAVASTLLIKKIVKDSVGVKINQTLSILCGALRKLLILHDMNGF